VLRDVAVSQATPIACLVSIQNWIISDVLEATLVIINMLVFAKLLTQPK
jgi:hypothetical protein